MSIVLVQEADAASSSVTLGASTTPGNTVVVAVACLGSTSATGVTGITLGGNPDNFALVSPGPPARDTTSPNGFLNVSVWADPSCAGGGTLSVTGTGVLAVWAWELSGLSGTADVAQVLAVNTYQDSWMASAAQTTVPAEAWVAIVAAACQTGTETITETGMDGWTLQTAYNGTSGSYDWGAVAAYQNVNTVGTPALNGTFSQPSVSVTAMVTFGMALPAAPAAPVSPGTSLVAPMPVNTVSSAASGTAGGTGNLTVHGNLAVSGTTRSAGMVYQGGAPVGLTPTGVKTGNYAAHPGDFVIVDASRTAQEITVIFPAAPASGTLIGVQLASAGQTAALVQASGADVFGLLPASTTQLLLNTTGATFIAQYRATNATWYIQSAAYTEPGINQGPGSPFPATPVASIPMPGDFGIAAWSYDPASLNAPFSGAALPGGNLYVIYCPVRATRTCVSFKAWITAAGSGLTSGENFAGVYDSNSSLLGATPDLTTSFGSTGLLSAGFTSTVTLTPPWVWMVFLANGTTKPSLACTANQSTGWANGPRIPRFGTVTGPFTSLPSSFAASNPFEAAAQYAVFLY